MKTSNFFYYLLQFIFIVFLGILFFASSQCYAKSENKGGEDMQTITLQIGNKIFIADLFENTSAQAFLDLLPLNINMHDLNANEKYYILPNKLPSKSGQIGEIKAGDIMLYGSDYLVIFYEDFNSPYSYTRLGKVKDITGLKTSLGTGSVQCTWVK